MRRVFDFLRLDDTPLMARRNYVAELRHTLLWGVIPGGIEGNIAGIVASKTFHASESITTLVWALPAIANVLNLLWSAVTRGHRRRQVFTLIALCGLVGVCSVGFTSTRWEHAGWVFAAQIGLTHLFLTGLITIRTTMWEVNYPHTHRARITGRLTGVRVLIALLTGVALSNLFDWRASTYQLVYPLLAALGVASLWPLRQVHVRGEKLELKRFRQHVAERHGATRHPLASVWTGLHEAVSILRTDRAFSAYMGAMFLLGSANFFTEPLLVYILTTRLKLSYFNSALLMTVIPTIVLLIGIRYWAPLFDRVGVLRFRTQNSAMWALSYAGTTLAVLIVGLGGSDYLFLTIPLLAAARVLNGLGSGGGTLAWNLGHLHFARAHQTELYMGIHVGLTGIRALVMPFCALLCNRLIGDWSFAVALALALVAHTLFRRQDAADRRSLAPARSPVDCAGPE